MNELGFNPLGNPELVKRTGYIEGREDLFDTKVITLNTSNLGENPDYILAFSRDPGSANALVPVMKKLLETNSVNISAVIDGRAEDIIKSNFNYDEQKLDSALDIDSVVHSPDVVLADASEEQGLDTYADATFAEAPMVLIEDFPGSSTRFLNAIKERPGLHFPEKICVMDEVAKQSLIKKLPELSEVIEVTGQPAFDRIANEDAPQISKETREKLGIGLDEKVIAFMSTDEVTSDQFEKICNEIAQANGSFKFIFRRHPRDNTSYEQYFEILEKYGIEPIDSRELKTDEISAAADIVFTSWSTAGLEAIYRGKPTVHVVDKEVLDVPETLELPLPAVSLNASIGIDNIKDIPEKIQQLLDPESELSRATFENMAKYYPNDGKNADRVTEIIKAILLKAKNLK